MADESMNSEPRNEGSLSDLDARLRAAREREARSAGTDGGGAGSTTAGLGLGLRIGVEMVAALAVGLGIGWGLDHWIGTWPVFTVVFFFLGSAAGVLNAYRASVGADDSVGFGAAMRRRKKRE